jgi:hypothetical protein
MIYSRSYIYSYFINVDADLKKIIIIKLIKVRKKSDLTQAAYLKKVIII